MTKRVHTLSSLILAGVFLLGFLVPLSAEEVVVTVEAEAPAVEAGEVAAPVEPAPAAVVEVVPVEEP